MYLEIWQMVVGVILILIVVDFIRLVALKLLGKRFRLFALLPDNDNYRLEWVAYKWNVETTEVIHNIEDNTFALVTNPSEKYKVVPIIGYKLEEYTGK